MESITKNRQSAETLRAMVAQAYGWPQPGPAGDEDWVSDRSDAEHKPGEEVSRGTL